MKFVEFSAFTGVGVKEVFGKIIWKKDRLFAEGRRKEILEKVLNEPIRDLREKGYVILTKKNGLRFLEALPYFYNGHRLCGSLVQEVKDG